jgi:hypothetical protein
MPKKVLFTGIPGVNLGEHVERLRKFVTESTVYRRSVYKPLKAEEHFVSGVKESNLLPEDYYTLLKKPELMIQALGLPKPLLRKAWATALQRTLDSENPAPQDDVFLCMHSAFYHQATREFFSPLDAGIIEGWHPDLVITLIDDIENCFDRLRVYGHMFSHSAYVYTGMKGFNNVLRNMRVLYDWRAIDMLEAERLAAEIGVRHFCVAVKHPIETLASLVFTSRPVVYLSHPISEPRRRLAGGDRKGFDEFTAQLGETCSRLRRGVTLIEPTTIDEFRLLRIKAPSREATDASVDLYLPRHNERWPCPPDPLWIKPGDEAEQPLDLGGCFAEETLNAFKKFRVDAAGGSLPVEFIPMEIADNLLSVLIGDITSQIDARDHKLVEQSDGLVVLRPVYKGNSSNGVEEEIKYHCQLCAIGEVRKAGLWIYTHRDDEFDYLRKEWLVGYLSEGLKNGTIEASGDEAVDEKAIRELAESLTFTASRAELASQVLQEMTARKIRFKGHKGREGPLAPRPEMALVDAQRKFMADLEVARPPYVVILEKAKKLRPDLHFEILHGPEISVDEFIGQVLQSCAQVTAEPAKGDA